MRLRLSALLFVALISAACGGGSVSKMAQATVPNTITGGAVRPRRTADHVFLVVEENRSYSTVYHNQMPWLSALGDKYGVATNYFSDEEGSLLDYLWLSSGSGERSFGCTGNDCAQPITDGNIFRELNHAGLSWKVYLDSLPKTGFMGPGAGNYVKRHNPAPWYSDVAEDPKQQQNILPFSQFSADLAGDSLPAYSIIVPDLAHDAHNGTPKAADKWLERNVGPLVDSSLFQPGSNSVMFITFDNGDRDAQGQVLTVVVGQNVVPGIKVDRPFRHENTLRTIMELLGLTNFPGASASAAPMNEFFK